jgi:hypothetical protein
VNANISDCLKRLNDAVHFVLHNERPFTKSQLKAILLRAQAEGHTTLHDIPDELVERVLAELKHA